MRDVFGTVEVQWFGRLAGGIHQAEHGKALDFRRFSVPAWQPTVPSRAP